MNAEVSTFTTYFKLFGLLHKDIMGNFAEKFGNVQIQDCEFVNRLIVVLTIDGIWENQKLNCGRSVFF